jgi:hypothetical protein
MDAEAVQSKDLGTPDGSRGGLILVRRVKVIYTDRRLEPQEPPAIGKQDHRP